MALAVINVERTACRARSKSLWWALSEQEQNRTSYFLIVTMPYFKRWGDDIFKLPKGHEQPDGERTRRMARTTSVAEEQFKLKSEINTHSAACRPHPSTGPQALRCPLKGKGSSGRSVPIQKPAEVKSPVYFRSSAADSSSAFSARRRLRSSRISYRRAARR